MYNYYISVENSMIVDGFSDGFREPKDSDILIGSGDIRHFTMLGMINPALVDYRGCHLYRYIQKIVNDNENISVDSNSIDLSGITLPDGMNITNITINGYITHASSDMEIVDSTPAELDVEAELLGYQADKTVVIPIDQYDALLSNVDYLSVALDSILTDIIPSLMMGSDIGEEGGNE